MCRAPEALNPLKALAMVAREKRKEQGSVAKEDNSRKRKLTTLEEIRMVRVCGKIIKYNDGRGRGLILKDKDGKGVWSNAGGLLLETW